jgi:hypothetical protein
MQGSVEKVLSQYPQLVEQHHTTDIEPVLLPESDDSSEEDLHG